MPELPELLTSYAIEHQPVWMLRQGSPTLNSIILRFVQPPRTHPNIPTRTIHPLEIPGELVRLARSPRDSIAYIEAAMVHARLLARPGSAGPVDLASINLNDIADQNDMSHTIAGIRNRLWSIALSEKCQLNVTNFILKILTGIPDEMGRAAAIVEVFEASNISPLTNGLPKGLNRLLLAESKIQRALAWVEYVQTNSRVHGDGEIGFSVCMLRARPKVTRGLMVQLGVPDKTLEHAVRISRGLDLIVLAALVRWVREILELGGDSVFWNIDSTRWHYRQLPEKLTQIYGAAEAADPAYREYNETCVKVAIDRMTAYNRDMLKRAKKRQGR